MLNALWIEKRPVRNREHWKHNHNIWISVLLKLLWFLITFFLHTVLSLTQLSLQSRKGANVVKGQEGSGTSFIEIFSHSVKDSFLILLFHQILQNSCTVWRLNSYPLSFYLRTKLWPFLRWPSGLWYHGHQITFWHCIADCSGTKTVILCFS